MEFCTLVFNFIKLKGNGYKCKSICHAVPLLLFVLIAVGEVLDKSLLCSNITYGRSF